MGQTSVSSHTGDNQASRRERPFCSHRFLLAVYWIPHTPLPYSLFFLRARPDDGIARQARCLFPLRGSSAFPTTALHPVKFRVSRALPASEAPPSHRLYPLPGFFAPATPFSFLFAPLLVTFAPTPLLPAHRFRTP